MSADYPLFPAAINPGTAFVYAGHPVAFDDNRFVSLTDMWKAAGSPAENKPNDWRSRDGKGFIANVARSLNAAPGGIIKAGRGKGVNAGTWAHWQVAVAYAKYLSHDFHRYVNEAFREWAEEKADPDLKARRAVEGYRRKGWDDGRITARLEGIVKRNLFTDALRGQGVEGHGYACCTDAINVEILGGTAKEVKLARGLPANASTRDCLGTVELAALRFAETLASESVKGQCAHGNGACCAVCRKAGAVVSQAVTAMGLTTKR